MSQDETSDTLDDFMESIGLDVKPTGPEDALMIEITGGGFNQLYIFRYWLMHEIHAFHDLKKNGCILRKIEKGVVVELTFLDYINIRTKYYLRMKYLPWFDKDMKGLGPASIDAMVPMLVGHDIIQQLLSLKYEELPKLRY